MSCPPLIELSQFVDAELDATAMLRVAEHVEGCATCRQSVATVEAIAGAAARVPDGGADTVTPECPSPESLLAYLTTTEATALALDAHIDGCEHCVATLQRLQRSVALIPEIPVLVPARLRERATGQTPLAAPRPAPAAPIRSLWERLLSGLRYPVLAPAAFATGILLYVVAQQVPLTPGLPPAGIRAVSQPGPVTRRVTAPEAWVYSEPSPRSALVAKLARGNAVDVSSEERGWYRVVLADGRTGWVERKSLQ